MHNGFSFCPTPHASVGHEYTWPEIVFFLILGVGLQLDVILKKYYLSDSEQLKTRSSLIIVFLTYIFLSLNPEAQSNQFYSFAEGLYAHYNQYSVTALPEGKKIFYFFAPPLRPLVSNTSLRALAFTISEER